MGHRVSTLSECSRPSGTGAGSAVASRAFLLAMLFTVAAAASSQSSSCPSSGRCCFVSAAVEPHLSASGSVGQFRFRRRQLPKPCVGATAAASADVSSSEKSFPPSWRSNSNSNKSRESNTLSLFRRGGADTDLPSSVDGSNSNKRKGGIPLSSYSWRRQRPTSTIAKRRRRPQDTTKQAADGPPAVRTVDGMPPHLAAAFDTTAVTNNDNDDSNSSSSDDHQLILTDTEYERRKLEWAQRYTSVSTLRQTFGTNRNALWGDLDPEQTRRLYHTLLPRALMGLYDMGLMRPHELAPLAYEARNAAKKYARERCIVPGRVLSMAYDGFRSLRDYGTWNPEGLSWDQIWDKYEAQIVDEFDFEDDLGEQAEEDELTKQICLRILERSCRTNTAVDQLLLGRDAADRTKKKEEDEMAEIRSKLDRDVHELLFEGAQTKSDGFAPTREQRRKLKERKREIKKEEMETRKELRATEKAFVRALRNEEETRRRKENDVSSRTTSSSDKNYGVASSQGRDRAKEEEPVRLTRQEVWFLRTIVGAKRKIRSLRSSSTPLIDKVHGTTTDAAARGKKTKVNNSSKTKKKDYEDDDHRHHHHHLVEISPPVGRAAKKSILEMTTTKADGGGMSSSSSSSHRRPKLWLGRGNALPRRTTNASVHPTEEVLTP